MLSTDRIAEHLNAAGKGEHAREHTEAAPRRRAPRLRAVDFSRPTKFTGEQERRLSRATDAFCRAASQRLSAELRVPLELEVINTTELNWSHAHAQIPQKSICALLTAVPLQTTLLLATEPALVLNAIDLLLGGSPQAAPRERRLTEIDWALARHFLASLVGQLSIIWSDIGGVGFELAGLDSPLETTHVAPVSEPTLSLTLEAHLGKASSTLVLLVPHASIAPMLAQMAAGDAQPGAAGAEHVRAVDAALRRVDVLLRAEVAAAEMSVEDVLALQPGDLLRLGAPTAAGGTLFADEAPICRVRMGRSGRRRAVQVQREPGI
jgi:flagellar motor switch protein FliM